MSAQRRIDQLFSDSAFSASTWSGAATSFEIRRLGAFMSVRKAYRLKSEFFGDEFDDCFRFNDC